MTAFLNNCGFRPSAGGLTDWVYSAALLSYLSPTGSGAVNGASYTCFARSDDNTQWEMAAGSYASSTGTFARTAIIASSTGAKVNFTAPPQILIVAAAGDVPSLSENNNFSGTITATGYSIKSAAPAYSFNSATGTLWGNLQHDGTDLYVANLLNGSIIVGTNGASRARFGQNILQLYSSGGGSVSLSVPIVGSGLTYTLPASSGTIVLADGSNNVAVNSVSATASPSSSWGFDAQSAQVTVSGGGSAVLADGAGLIVLTDGSSTGNTGMYLTGGSAAALVSQTGAGAPFVAPTTTPASNKYCVAFDGTHYRIYNGRATSVTFYVAMLRARPTV